jgi:hypothetical protein
MWDKVVFFELRHYGDLHITRNFVRYVMRHIPAKTYTYVLKSDCKVFADFPGLEFEGYDPAIHPFTDYSAWNVINETLYINTSCGANEMAFYQGTRIQTAHAIFKHFLWEYCGHTISEDLTQFVPQIDFDAFKVNNVKQFMQTCTGRRKVLFVNGATQSGQALNVDMTPLITFFAEHNPDILFFVANKEDYSMKASYPKPKNIVFCKEVIGIAENDITETAYFSLFCDTVIGRTSGVYTLSIEKRNVVDSPKKFICISHTERDKDIGITELFPALAGQFIWHNDFTFGGMVDTIQRHI